MASSNRRKNYALIASVIVAGGLLLSSTKAAAQTGIALRLGQPDEVTLGVDGRLTLDAAAFAPVDKSNFTYLLQGDPKRALPYGGWDLHHTGSPRLLRRLR